MLFQVLDKMRGKPKIVRDQYALGIAVCCTVFVGAVWTLSLPGRFEQANVASVNAASSPGAFSGIWAQLKSQFKTDTSPSGVEVIATTTTGVTTGPQTAASSTQAALDFKITDTNRDELQQGTTTKPGADSNYGFATGTPKQTILIATTSSETTAR